MSGLFITLEGGEGAGKTSQIKGLESFFSARGFEVLLTREPGGTPEAEKIRDLLVLNDGGNWTPMAEILLFFAARSMHIEKVIKPALAEGKIVICDRFTDSTRAYQSYGHGVDVDIIESFVHLAIQGFEPDITFLLDISPEKGLARSKNRLATDLSGEDKFENLDLSFHVRLREGFLAIAERYPERFQVIDAEQPVHDVQNDIEAFLKDYLEENKI